MKLSRICLSEWWMLYDGLNFGTLEQPYYHWSAVSMKPLTMGRECQCHRWNAVNGFTDKIGSILKSIYLSLWLCLYRCRCPFSWWVFHECRQSFRRKNSLKNGFDVSLHHWGIKSLTYGLPTLSRIIAYSRLWSTIGGNNWLNWLFRRPTGPTRLKLPLIVHFCQL
jgi:hypothetical protein